jgi:ribosomal protein S18 acetylase RimI-like enzyme
MLELLDNILWHSLYGPQSRFAVGNELARRYAPGFSPIIGFRDGANADLDMIRPFCESGEHFYIDGWSGKPPADWRIDEETTMYKMVYQSADSFEDVLPEAIRLGPEHARQALELAILTNPGPFGPRTIELGEYFGVFRDGKLVSMAGERMFAGSLRELSGICTHPDFQGQGFARKLMCKLLKHQIRRGETPFLHVMRKNTAAIRLYRSFGFEIYKESPVRVISPL